VAASLLEGRDGSVVCDKDPPEHSVTKLGLNSFFVEYREYGSSTGKAQLVAMLGDGDAALAAAEIPPEKPQHDQSVKSSRVLQRCGVFGQSDGRRLLNCRNPAMPSNASVAVKLELEFAFELPGQMPTIGQGLAIKSAPEFRTHKNCLPLVTPLRHNERLFFRFILLIKMPRSWQEERDVSSW